MDFELYDASQPSLETKNELEQGIEIAPGVEYGGTEWLAIEKIEARNNLLVMPPEAAQKLVDQTLYPTMWSVRKEAILWFESLPTTNDEETDS